jgi:PhnB protein
MASIHSHITFNGNCREAMQFYQKCLGGELHFQTVGDTQAAKQLPAKMKKTILHAQLNTRKFVLMGSDMVEDAGLIKGNAVQLLLSCESEKEIKSRYKKLSLGGKQKQPLKTNARGVLLGSLTDKYGVCWLLTFSNKKQ